MKKTFLRDKIYQFIKKQKRPFTYFDISKYLEMNNIKFNKSTIFRNLNTFVRNNILRQIIIDANKRYFEYKYLSHHHHFICLKCSKIIDFYNNDIEKKITNFFKKLDKKYKIKITNHSFEVFGYCQKCS